MIDTGIRAISMHELFTKKYVVMDFKGEWLALMGKPQCTGAIIIWGQSSNGKTRFAIKFAKYLSNFEKVAYNSIEEGASATLKRAFSESGISIDEKKIHIWDMASLENVKKELSKRKSPNIIFIDSLQHWKISPEEYKSLVTEFRKKLFVFISHADGKDPAEKIGKEVRYDANVKIRVDRFIATVSTRCDGGNGQPYVIWEEKAKELHGVSYDSILMNKTI